MTLSRTLDRLIPALTMAAIALGTALLGYAASLQAGPATVIVSIDGSR